MAFTSDILALFEANEWKSLNEYIKSFSKKGKESDQQFTAMVRYAMEFIDKIQNLEARTELIETLIQVCAGKIHVVVESANSMRQLAVETVDSKANIQKISSILEEIRLCLDQNDFYKAEILSRKIRPTMFEETKGDHKDVVEQLWELKRNYYQLMIRYYLHETNYLQLCRCYINIYNIPSIRENPSEWIPVLKRICCYLILSPHDSMQSGLVHSTLEDKNLSEIPNFKLLLKQLATMEIINWTSFWKLCLGEFMNEDVLGGSLGVNYGEDQFKMRINEHNIMVVSKWYSRITLTRLAELLCLTIEEAENNICEMVQSKALFAKIDGLKGIVCFQIEKDVNEIMCSWALNVDKLLRALDNVWNKISRNEIPQHIYSLKDLFLLLIDVEIAMDSGDLEEMEKRLTTLKNFRENEETPYHSQQNNVISGRGREVDNKIARALDLVQLGDLDGAKAAIKEIKGFYGYCTDLVMLNLELQMQADLELGID